MKAVIPAAGFGTRFLPFTKSVPKELIPILDKPVIQYVVEEAVASGCDDILIILSAGKEAIMRHFNPEAALEQRLAETGKTKLFEELRAIGSGATIQYACQKELRGLGDAVLCAESFVGNEPFALLLGDNITSGPRPMLAELLDVFRKTSSFVVAVEEIPREQTFKYGVIDGTDEGGGLYRLRGLIEKPDPAQAPSNLAICSRYVFPASVMSCLKNTKPGKNNEIQLTDAMRLLLECEGGHALKVQSKRHDAGDKLSFLLTTLEFAMKKPEYRDAIRAFLEQLDSRPL